MYTCPIWITPMLSFRNQHLFDHSSWDQLCSSMVNSFLKYRLASTLRSVKKLTESTWRGCCHLTAAASSWRRTGCLSAARSPAGPLLEYRPASRGTYKWSPWACCYSPEIKEFSKFRSRRLLILYCLYWIIASRSAIEAIANTSLKSRRWTINGKAVRMMPDDSKSTSSTKVTISTRVVDNRSKAATLSSMKLTSSSMMTGSRRTWGAGMSTPYVRRYEKIFIRIEWSIERMSPKHQSCSFSQKNCRLIWT